jgi:tRNA nucleotidyltransferase (CCA-adding enzyme)
MSIVSLLVATMEEGKIDANYRTLESGESVTPLETSVFALIKQCADSHDPPVIARVAGGWVRDKLLGLQSDDLDITLENTTGTAFALFMKTFAEIKIHSNPTVVQ